LSESINLGPGWADLDFGQDDEAKVLRIGQSERGVILPKTHLRRLIEKLEEIERSG
jgi:hypothetical protein